MINLDEPLTTDQLFSRTKQRRQLLLKRQGVVLVIALVVGVLFMLNVFEPIERSLLDLCLSRSQKEKASSVLLIPISEKSIQQIGAWPWPSFQHAVILELLERWGARSVYFEGDFSDSETEEEQGALIQVLEKKKIPVFFSAQYGKQFKSTGPGLAVLDLDNVTAKSNWTRPPSQIAKHSFIGHRNVEPDQDRIFRFWRPWIEQPGAAYPMAALKMLMELKIRFDDDALVKMQETKSQLIPWNRKLFESWPRIEFADLMQSYLAVREGMKPLVSPKIFEGRDIFIGLTHESRMLSGLTPWGKMTFPIEVTAMVYDGLNDSDKILNQVASLLWTGIVFVIIATLLVIVTGLQVGMVFWVGLAGLIACLLSVWAGCFYFGIWLPAATFFLFLLISAAAVFAFDALYAKQERSALFHLATRDGLTGLYVIRHFRVIMNQMTREARARKENIAVILMDIDHFKKINDTYGHPAGDMILKKTAEKIQAAVRQKRAMKDIDFVARYGGEEFIILVRRNSLQNVAERIAERIRTTVQAAQYDWNGTKISVTVSLGVAILGDTENIPDAMVHRADKALYLAKQRGRNRVCTQDDIEMKK